MEQSPRIVMRCPACSREFPADTAYCDTCSVSLEAVEMERREEKSTVAIRRSVAQGDLTGSERIEDSKIDSLKADIEQRFVTTVLLELEHLRKLQSRKERSSSLPKHEAELAEIISKTAKLESILENLAKKIESDLDDLRSRSASVAKPGLLDYFSENGRYYRALVSDLSTKHRVLTAIRTRKPSSGLRTRFAPVVIAVAACLIVLSAVLLLRNPSSRPEVPMPSAPAAVTSITAQEISNLLDDIRQANLTKDLSLWESRYTSAYLAQPGKRASQIDQWNRYRYRSLSYRIESLDLRKNDATAVISWEMVLTSSSDPETKVVVQRLVSDFTIENGRVKISRVRRAEQ